MPSGPAHFLVDNDPTKSYDPSMANLVNNVLNPAGLPVTYDNTTAFVGTSSGPVIGYVSHGVNQALTPANYISTGLNISLANGAVFDTWESYNAYSFYPNQCTPTKARLLNGWPKAGRLASATCKNRGQARPR